MDHLELATVGFDSPVAAPEAPLSFVGIDSGLKGYTARITPGSPPDVELVKTPHFGTAKKPTGYDLDGMIRLAYSWRGRVALAFIEKQRGYRENGHEGNFKTGLGYGLWLAFLRVADIPVEELYPQQWKQQLGILPPRAKPGENKKLVEGLSDSEAKKVLSKRRNERSKDSKDRARQKAVSLFPKTNLLRTPRCKVPDDNLCEALLLAEMARRLYAGR